MRLRPPRNRTIRSHTMVLTMATAAVLAGCVDGTDGASAADVVGIDGQPAYIAGLVLDSEFFPVSGAFVTTAEGQAETTTSSDGRFRLGPLEAGHYHVLVEKDGYALAETEAAATSEETTDVRITLEAVRGDVPYHLSVPHTTFVMCASYNIIGGVPCTKLVDYVAGTSLSPDEKFWFHFMIDNPGLVDVLFEMVWEPQPLGHDMLLKIQTPPNQPLTAATVNYFSISGGTPLRGWAIANEANQGREAVFEAEPGKVMYEGLTIWSNGNSTIPLTSLYLNHRTDTWITFFHNRAGPREFTTQPDE